MTELTQDMMLAARLARILARAAAARPAGAAFPAPGAQAESAAAADHGAEARP